MGIVTVDLLRLQHKRNLLALATAEKKKTGKVPPVSQNLSPLPPSSCCPPPSIYLSQIKEMLHLASQSLPSPSQRTHKTQPLTANTAPIHLQTYQPNQPHTADTDGMLNFTPPRRRNLFDWLFGFLSDGSVSVPGTSTILGQPRKSSLFRQRQPTGGLLSRTIQSNNQQTQPHHPSSQPQHKSQSHQKSPFHLFPPWSSWKNWTKISLDFYIRLLHTPQYSRLRLKQTIAPLPIIKLKPVIDLAYRGPANSPLTMHLDVKLLDCLKYRVHTDGSSYLQVRARAPMSDPRFTMDVIYERHLGTALDSVKITFRALNVAFLKAPSPGFGCKFPIRFNHGIKSTIRVKKFIAQTKADPSTSRNHPKRLQTRHSPFPNTRELNHTKRPGSGVGSTRQGNYAETTQLGIYGPIGIDIKLRCLEYR